MSATPWLDSLTGLEIAIIGMAGRFPHAPDLERFWQNLRDGVEAITIFSDEELADAGVSEALRQHPAYVRSGAVLEDADCFDAAFFGYYPREAQILDPQQRVFLECAWAALERAGYAPGQPTRSIGVFAGASTNGYLHLLLNSPDVLANTDVFELAFANDKDYLATRVAYKLGLEGPSFTVQTACSTSLVAVHLACQSLLNGECDMALAGGISIAVPQRSGYLPVPGGIQSPDGHCRAFDQAAQGTFRGEGGGVVVLRRLQDALAAGDTIHALIKGSAINNDGNRKIGFTAPSLEGQARVIQAAHVAAEVDPETISYIEAHGTGTPLGDPIEVAALTRAFRAGTDRRGFCRIGSVKTNIGHLDVAAGIAGLMKTTLALRHTALPPSLHFSAPNPEIDFAASPFQVNAELQPWPSDGGPRRAGVSSFGVGGTNAHVVLEEAPPPSPGAAGRSQQLLLLSAKSKPALQRMAANLAAHLDLPPELPLADVAYTLHVGRVPFEQRLALVAADRAEASAILRGALADRQLHGLAQVQDRPVVFMFPGGGAQYVGMARGLYESEAVFRAEIDRCAELLRPHLGRDLRTVLYPAGPGADQDAINQSAIFPAAIFAVEYALAQQLIAWGIRPAGMIGHSLGEYVAATLAGVFSLEDALALIALRGRLFERLPRGAMLSVSLGAAELEPLLDAERGALCISVINAPRVCVVSGAVEAVEALAQRLAQRGDECQRLHLTIAAHSPAIDAITGEFLEFLQSRRLNVPTMPFISNVSGAWIRPEEATDPHYWAAQLRQTVRFADGIATLLDDPARIFLEVGPGWTLSSLVRLQRTRDQAPLTLRALRHVQDEQPDLVCLLSTVGRLWTAGVSVDGRAFYAGQARRRVELPSYPFERQRYWVAAEHSAAPVSAIGVARSEEQAGHHAAQPGAQDAPAGDDAPQSTVERRLAAIWQDLFGIARIGRHDNFFELGGHSLLATRLLFRVNEAFGTDLLLKTLLLAPSVAQLAAVIRPDQQGAARPTAGIDLARETRLDERIAPPPQRSASSQRQPTALLLTGATGYLGAYLLHELLQQTSATIFCLVRAADAAAGFQRIRQTLERYQLWQERSAGRIVALPGDLEQPLLGLGEDQFQRLAQQIDAIYHCGARVHFTSPYESLKASNVTGTQEVLRLAASQQLKPVHFVSTTAVFAPAPEGGLTGEDSPLGDVAALSTGYAQSKWVAEQLLAAARARGIPVAIYRPGAVTGDTRTGICRGDDAIWRLLKSCVQLGLAPATDERISGAPVDYVSRALVAISRQPDALGRTFHLTAPEATPWRTLFTLVRELGYPLRDVSYAEWRSALLSQADQEDALFPLIYLLEREAASAERRFDTQHAAAALAHSDIRCPPLDDALLRRYLAYFAATGFVAPPPSSVDEQRMA